jgi:hypothetical protein
MQRDAVMPVPTFLVEAVEEGAERGGGCPSAREGEQALQGCGASGVNGHLCVRACCAERGRVMRLVMGATPARFPEWSSWWWVMKR